MKKRLVFILSFLLALLVSVGAAIWIIVYQTKSPYPTELSGEFSLELSFDNNLLTAQNGQLKGDLIKKGLATNDTNAVTTLYVKHELGDKTYKYPIHQAATTSLNNTEFEYGVAEGEDTTFEFTDTYSLLTAQNTTEVAVKVLLGGNSNVNSDTQKFLRALLKLPTPDAEGAEAAPATFDRGGVAFKVTSNYVSAAYINKTATMQAIAYNGSNNYGTIEGALGASASGTIYVKPQTTVTLTTTKVGNSTVGAIGSVKENDGVPKNPYIIKNCTIASGVTLCLPWEGTKATPATETVQSHESLVCLDDYPVSNLTSGTLNTQLCTNHVTIHNTDNQNDGVLTNLGTLIVGGVVNGGNGGSNAGYSANQYALLTLKENAKIINGQSDGSVAAAIQCYGYIFEDTNKNGSQIILYGKSSYISPFKVMEHRGGSAFAAMAGGLGAVSNPKLQCAPFNRFYMPNTSVEMTFHHGSSLFGYANLYTSATDLPIIGTIPAQHNITTVKLFGTSDEYLLKFTNASTYIKTKYNPLTEIHDIDVYGSSALNALALTVNVMGSSMPLSTASVYFPLSWHFDISLSKGNQTTATFTSASQKVKLFPGASVTIGAGVNATLPSIVVYDTFTDTYATSTNLRYESGKSSANLIVNGSLTVDSLGGPVQTDNANASLKVNTSATITCKEVVSGVRDGISFNATYQDVTKTIAAPKYVDATKNYTSVGSYYSAKRSNNTYGWYATPYTVTVHNQYNSSNHTFTDTKSTEISDKNGFTIPKQTSDLYYTFGGWFYDNGYTLPVDTETSNKIYQTTDLYAQWTLNNYTIQYVLDTGIEKYDSSKLVIDGLDALPTTISYENGFGTNIPTVSYTSESPTYTFTGWKLGSATGTTISAYNNTLLNAAEFNEEDNTRTVTLYATWTQATTYKITYDYGAYAEYIDDYDWPTKQTVLADEIFNAPTVDTFNQLTAVPQYYTGWAIKDANGSLIPVTCLTEDIIKTLGEETSVTVYALWSDKHILSFNLTTNKGNLPNLTIDDVYLLDDQSYTLSQAQVKDPNGTTVTINNYDDKFAYNRYFDGWLNGTDKVTAITITGDTELTAKWVNKYTLSFETDYPSDVKGSPADIDNPTSVYLMPNQAYTDLSTHDSAMIVNDHDVTVNIYFNGWKIKDTETSFTSASTITSDTIIKVNWGTKNTFTLKENSNEAYISKVTIVNGTTTLKTVTFSKNEENTTITNTYYIRDGYKITVDAVVFKKEGWGWLSGYVNVQLYEMNNKDNNTASNSAFSSARSVTISSTSGDEGVQLDN